METAEYVEILDREGRALVVAAEAAGPDAKVPTCPEWQVRDLLRHTGMVHRWAAAFVTEGYTTWHPDGGRPDLDGAELLTWFREGHLHLVGSLRSAAPGLECWSFLPAPSPLAFWARRQAHETTVHRFDAQSARGDSPDTVAPGFAADGIDELLRGFHARAKSRLRSDRPRVLRVRATDVENAVWTMRLSPDPATAVRGGDGDADADCEVAGPAAQVYLSLWNRLPFPEVTGDRAIADLWREKSAVTWS
jgi:uncharacterized protein (TIGR03083 family)